MRQIYYLLIIIKQTNKRKSVCSVLGVTAIVIKRFLYVTDVARKNARAFVFGKFLFAANADQVII